MRRQRDDRKWTAAGGFRRAARISHILKADIARAAGTRSNLRWDDDSPRGPRRSY
jgi:hypothetical protein